MTTEVRALIHLFYLPDMPDEDIPARIENAYREGIVNLKTVQRRFAEFRNGKTTLVMNRSQGGRDEKKIGGNQNHN